MNISDAMLDSMCEEHRRLKAANEELLSLLGEVDRGYSGYFSYENSALSSRIRKKLAVEAAQEST